MAIDQHLLAGIDTRQLASVLLGAALMRQPEQHFHAQKIEIHYHTDAATRSGEELRRGRDSPSRQDAGSAAGEQFGYRSSNPVSIKTPGFGRASAAGVLPVNRLTSRDGLASADAYNSFWPVESEPPENPTTAETVESRSVSSTTSEATASPATNSPSRPTSNASRASRDGRKQTFRRVLLNYYRKHRDGKTPKSWSQYVTLLRKWEQFHNGRGPDVRDVTEVTLQAFFESRSEWASRTSWKRNRDQLLAMLKFVCPRTATNQNGSDQPLFESIDRLPIWRLPPARWFADRDTQTTRHGGHSPFEGDLLTFDQFRRVLTACDTLDNPGWWRSLMAWVITYASRRGDFLTLKWEQIDFKTQTLRTNETKRGNRIVVPIASRFIPALERLRTENARGPWYSNSTHLDRWFYPGWKLIWATAEVPLRNPHQLRDECSNWWNEHAREFGNLITGHKAGNVRDQHYDRNRRGVITPAFREAVETFPGQGTWPEL